MATKRVRERMPTLRGRTLPWRAVVLAGVLVAAPQPQRLRGGAADGCPFAGDIRRVGGAGSVAGRPGMLVRGDVGAGVCAVSVGSCS